MTDLIKKYNLKIGDLIEIQRSFGTLTGVFYAFTEKYIFITADDLNGSKAISPFRLYEGSYAMDRKSNYRIKKIGKVNININFLRKKYASMSIL